MNDIFRNNIRSIYKPICIRHWKRIYLPRESIMKPNKDNVGCSYNKNPIKQLQNTSSCFVIFKPYRWYSRYEYCKSITIAYDWLKAEIHIGYHFHIPTCRWIYLKDVHLQSNDTLMLISKFLSINGNFDPLMNANAGC